MSKPISNSKLITIEAKKLRIHPVAQRRLLPTKLKKLIDTLDLDAIGVLHAVVYKIGAETAIWIIDGQHRLAAILYHGFGDWLVEVKIHLDATTDSKACALFLKLNDRAPVSPYDKFLSELQANVPEASGAMSVVRLHNFSVGRTSEDGVFQCVKTLKTIWDYDAGRTLDSVLKIVSEVWGKKAESLEGQLLLGIAKYLVVRNRSCDLNFLAEKLSKYPGGAPGLLGDARGIRRYKPQSSVADCVSGRITELLKTKTAKEKRLGK